MKIRNATYDDINAMIELGGIALLETRYVVFDYDHDKVRDHIKNMIDYEKGIALIAEEDGQFAGSLLAEIYCYYFGKTTASINYDFVVHPDFRGSSAAIRLLNKYKHIAKDAGVEDIMMGVNANIEYERVGKLFEKVGFTQIGSLFTLGNA